MAVLIIAVKPLNGGGNTNQDGEFVMRNDLIIRKISRIRVDNNKQWMALLRLALKSEPDKAKSILRRISKNDNNISKLGGKLK